MFGKLSSQQALTDKGPIIRDGHDNFFTPLRLLFASLVVIGHAFAIALRDATMEPQILYHYTFSYLAVNLFFIVSGFLVTKSMVYRGDAPSFISARGLRIFPALIAHVLFVMFVIGPLATKSSLGAFFSHPDWYLQPLKVLTFYETNMTMPRIFETNGEPFGSVPLWTLRYEVDDLLPTFQNLLRFGIAYGLGATIYAYHDRLNLSWVILLALAAASYLLRETAVIEVIVNVLLAWIVFLVAYMRLPKLEWMQRIPDLSYGIYIYHWCILQMIFYWLPNLTVFELTALAFPPTVILAALSWYIVEKPALRSKSKCANWLRNIGPKFKFGKKELLLD